MVRAQRWLLQEAHERKQSQMSRNTDAKEFHGDAETTTLLHKQMAPEPLASFFRASIRARPLSLLPSPPSFRPHLLRLRTGVTDTF